MTSGSSGYLAAVIEYPSDWTSEQIDADIARRNEMLLREQERVRMAEEERQLAEVRSNELLAEFLTAMQAKELVQSDAFVVKGRSGVRYRIRRNRQTEELDWRGKTVGLYCTYSPKQIPSGDLMLAQKLMLENDERKFLRTANRFTPR